MKKLLMLVLSAMFLMGAASTFVACQDNREVLYVATNAEFPPFESIDKKGKYVGFDMDLIKEIAKILNMRVVVDNMDFDAIIAAVQTGKCQVAIAAMTVNEERALSVDFSEGYHVASQMVVYKATDTVMDGLTEVDQIIDQLKGKRIGVQRGTVGQYFTEGDEEWEFEEISDKVDAKDNIALAAVDMKNNKLDYIVTDELPAKNLVKNNTEFRIKDVSLTEETYAIAVNKAQSELLSKINEALNTLKDNGKIEELVNKYLKEAVSFE